MIALFTLVTLVNPVHEALADLQKPFGSLDWYILESLKHCSWRNH